MKRVVSLGVAVGCVAVTLAILVRGQQQSSVAFAEPAKQNAKSEKEKSDKPEQKSPATPPAATVDQQAQGKVVYTFDDEAKMHDFTGLWQQRQGIYLRMTVLQAYWNEEQAALKQLNEKLAADYKIDPAKDYVLNTEKRSLIERPPQPATGAAQQPSAPGAATPGTPGSKP